MVPSPLLAGAASLPLRPPLGLDMQGFVNRMTAGQGYGEPMEVGALVVEANGNRVVIIALDLAICPVAPAEKIRSSIAIATGCGREAVLLNFNHSHGLPGVPSPVKLGGQFPTFTPEEHLFADKAASIAVSAARLALSRLEPTRLELGAAEVEGISVNRRERTPDGETILGWNPEGACDRSVQTAAFKREDGSVIATLVNFACHPVVLGRDVPEYSSDFVGSLRRTVKSLVGGECLFLQGAAGNILPLEGFFSVKGPEVQFGVKVALKAVEAILSPFDPSVSIQKHEFGSTTPISLYRHVPSAPPPAIVSAAEEMVRFPFRLLPSREELEEEIARRKIQLANLTKNPDPKILPNTILYHLHWAGFILQKIAEGELEDHVFAPIQAIRIGNLGLSAAPGEIFTEIGLAVKQKSRARGTFYCGYTNGILGYFPTAEEYPYGGYEPNVSHRGYGQPSAFHPDCAVILVEEGSQLLNGLFASDPS